VFERAATIFTAGEELGELIVVLCPFFLYKAFSNNKYTLLLPVLFIGLFLSGTRSAALLVVFELIIFFFMTRSQQFGKKKIIAISIVALFLLSIGGNFMVSIFDILISRFQETALNIQKGTSFAEFINRGDVWSTAWDTTWRTFSFFGHGLVQADLLGMNKGYGNFHCLYLTLIFQYGVIGFSIFIVFFFYLIKGLISRLQHFSKKDLSYSLIMACMLSVSAFLVNEVKFEFNRGDSYQQFIWAVFAVFFLAGKTMENRESTK
jgi:O-antigen ligase